MIANILLGEREKHEIWGLSNVVFVSVLAAVKKIVVYPLALSPYMLLHFYQTKQGYRAIVLSYYQLHVKSILKSC